MNVPAYLRSLTARLLHRSEIAKEVDEELRSHVHLRADDLERSGLDRAEAERRARIEFGGYVKSKEESHQAMGGEFIDPLKTTVVQNQRCMTTWVLRKRRG